MERKMFKAENNSFTPADDDRTSWFNLLVKFPTAVSVIFAIVVYWNRIVTNKCIFLISPYNRYLRLLK